MHKITYLFGAGASINALPTVNTIPDRIKSLIEHLQTEDLKLDDNSTYEDLELTDKNKKSKRAYQNEMIESLIWMLTESKNHASIDTFAKKLYIKENYLDFEKLKVAMSVFFIFEQALNKPDFRYDSFFASLIDSLSSFPDNVRILSWNYDYQFELSFSEYTDNVNIDYNQRALRVNSKFGFLGINLGFGIYKLNGTTAFYTREGRDGYLYTNNLKLPVDKTFVDKITRNYAAVSYTHNVHSSLSFAWEKEKPDKSIIAKAIENTSDTYSLVIIGYSFPFFNRVIDRQIIGNMTNLKKVYFQAPDADILKERFKAIKDDLTGIELIPKFDLDQFLLPNEL
jgi:hypothetical protein